MNSILKALAALALAAAPAAAGPFLLVTTNTTLYSIDSTGAANVFATSDGNSESFSFTNARGIAAGPDGRYYVADLSGKIYAVSSSGIVTTFATLDKAYGLAWSGNTLFATTFAANGTVSSFDSGGALIGTALSTGYSNLTDILVGPNSDLFVSSGGAHGVLHIDSSNNISVFANTAPQGASLNGSISTPRGIAFVGDNLYVADSGSCSGPCNPGNPGISVFNEVTGAFQGQLATGLGNPQGLVFDSASNSLYFASNTGNAIKVSDLSGNTTNYVEISGAHNLLIVGDAVPEPGTVFLTMGALSAIFLKLRRRTA